jgi:hypothetical protein
MIDRIPRWQHVVLIVLCAAGLLAAVINVAVAGSWGARGLHAVLGLLLAAALVRLVTAYRERPAE